jgi:hypothetical protein
MNVGEAYNDFLSRACSEVDIIGNNYGDTIERRGSNVVYTARTGRRQDLWLFGPKPVHVAPSMISQLTSFLSKLHKLVQNLFLIFLLVIALRGCADTNPQNHLAFGCGSFSSVTSASRRS